MNTLNVKNHGKASWKLDNYQKKDIVKRWINGNSTRYLSKIFDCDDESIRRIIKHRLSKKYYHKICKIHNKKFELLRTKKSIIIPPLNEGLCWWAGLVKGDGHVAKRYIKLEVMDKDLANRWMAVGERLFGINPAYSVTSRNSYSATFYSIKLVSYVSRRLGSFGDYRWDVPNRIKRSNNRNKLAFIRGLFDAEGCAKYSKNNRGCRITLTSVRRSPLTWIKNTLIDNGISCKVHKEKRKERNKIYHIIGIGRFINVERFNELVGFSVDRKAEFVNNYIQKFKVSKNGKFNVGGVRQGSRALRNSNRKQGKDTSRLWSEVRS